MTKLILWVLNLKTPSSTPTTPSPTPKPKQDETWCVPKAGLSEDELQANLDYVCGQGLDCSPIQPGGACFEPATVASHATYAMNLLYQKSDRNPLSCDFSHTATLTSTSPSKYTINTTIGHQLVLLFGSILNINCLCRL